MVPRFYVEGALRAGGIATLSEDAAHHAIRVLRLRQGDDITLFNGLGGEVAARIASIDRLRLTIELLEHRAIEREAPLAALLVQGVSSGERMDFTVRKAVELGVAAIQPVLASASVARPKGERVAARQAHWQKVAIAACEQCGRNCIPPVHPLLALEDYRAAGDGARILLSPRSELAFSDACKRVNGGVTLAAGPEAGFNAAEESAFVEAGFVPARLGPRVLRTETAAIAALAALNALKGDF